MGKHSKTTDWQGINTALCMLDDSYRHIDHATFAKETKWCINHSDQQEYFSSINALISISKES